ncbi:MAG: HDOD domain-containing protein [Polyangiaceae bacterium]
MPSKNSPGYGWGVVTLDADDLSACQSETLRNRVRRPSRIPPARTAKVAPESPALPPNPEEQLRSASLVERLNALFTSPSYEPPLLPTAAMQLLEMSHCKTCSFADILKVLESDPMVAARVLKVAQSPVYAGKAQIQSLEQALVRLGLHNLGDLFLQVTMTARVFRARAYQVQMEQQRRHAVATAHASRLVCRATALPDEYAFLCGLLHDVGFVAVLIALSEPNNGIRGPAGALPYDVVRDAAMAVHTHAGALICDAWRLPQEVKLVVQHHHQPRINGIYHPMSTVVHLADLLVTKYELSEPVVVDANVQAVRETVNISSRAWQNIEQTFHAQAKQLGLVRA